MLEDGVLKPFPFIFVKHNTMAQLTKRELDLMSVLWDRGSATVTEVMTDLADDIAYSTVMTIMRTLESKGHARHEQEGKAFRFFPLTEPDDAADTALGRIVNKVFHGSRELVINRLVSDENVSAEEIRRIKENLDRRLKELEQ
jgi:BlaI family penicillinase repressor